MNRRNLIHFENHKNTQSYLYLNFYREKKAMNKTKTQLLQSKHEPLPKWREQQKSSETKAYTYILLQLSDIKHKHKKCRYLQ